jgi:beta-lactamase class A
MFACVTLTDDVKSAVAGLPGVFGIYARNLTTGDTVALDADRVMAAESTAKTGALIMYSRLVGAGTIDPATRVELTDADKYIGTGVLRFLATGLQPTLEDLAWLMIIVSDNTATAMLLQRLGTVDDFAAAMHALGCPTLRINEIEMGDALAGTPFSVASPRDLAELYTHLDERCRTILYRQQHLIGLPRRLPHMAMAADVDVTMPVRVYNKTGNGIGRFVDSGLFETDAAAWVVAAMADEQTDFASRPEDAAPNAFARIGELLFDAWGGVTSAP